MGVRADRGDLRVVWRWVFDAAVAGMAACFAVILTSKWSAEAVPARLLAFLPRGGVDRDAAHRERIWTLLSALTVSRRPRRGSPSMASDGSGPSRRRSPPRRRRRLVRAGLESTLVILGHKLRGVTVVRGPRRRRAQDRGPTPASSTRCGPTLSTTPLTPWTARAHCASRPGPRGARWSSRSATQPDRGTDAAHRHDEQAQVARAAGPEWPTPAAGTVRA